MLGTRARRRRPRFEIAFWNKVFYPAAVIVMMILALPFAHFQRRQGGVGLPHLRRHDARARVLPASAGCSRNLGVLNDWPPLFSALLPLAVFLGLSVSMLYWLERR